MSTKGKQPQLTDSEYIRWAECLEWSPTQAVYLLHGLPPPDLELTTEQLSSQFPRAEKLFQPDPDPDFDQAEYLRCPTSWVSFAVLNGIKVADGWIAIFPMSGRPDLGFLLDDEPDYHQFVKVFTRDTPTCLRELAGYLLNRKEPERPNPPDDYNNILRDMNVALKIKAATLDELPNKLVSPRSFMEHCFPDHFHSDTYCLHWMDWSSNHPVLTDWLNTTKHTDFKINPASSAMQKKGGKARVAKYDPLRKKAIQEYEEGNFQSRRQASIKLLPVINEFSETIDGPRLSEDSGQETIYKWLLKHTCQKV